MDEKTNALLAKNRQCDEYAAECKNLNAVIDGLKADLNAAHVEIDSLK